MPGYLLVLGCLVAAGCTYDLGSFGAISIQSATNPQTSAASVHACDCRSSVPFTKDGYEPSIRAAMDNALAGHKPGKALTNVTVDEEVTFIPPIFWKVCYVVTGQAIEEPVTAAKRE